MFVARYDPKSETKPRQVESTLPGVLKQKQ
jgi:hypothetical protein